MPRWKAALRRLWQTEPAAALVSYFLLSAADIAYIHLAGGTFLAAYRDSWAAQRFTLTPAGGGGALAGGLLVYAYFTWRIWLGGYIAWTLSLLWKFVGIVAAASACFMASGAFTAGLLVLSTASLLPLFAVAVLTRAERPSRRSAARRLRARASSQSASRLGL